MMNTMNLFVLFILQLSPPINKKVKCVSQSPVVKFVANKQITVRSTKIGTKTNAASSKTGTPTPKISVTKQSNIIHPNNSHTKQISQSNRMPNNIMKSSIVHSKNNNVLITTNTINKSTSGSVLSQSGGAISSDGKYFQKKISTGEITLVPLKQKDPLHVKNPHPSHFCVKTDPKPTVITKSSRELPIAPTKSSIGLPSKHLTRPTNSNTVKPAKRVAPTKISDEIATLRANSTEKSSDSDMLSRDSSVVTNDDSPLPSHHTLERGDDNVKTQRSSKYQKNEYDTPINEDYQTLIDACREADPTDDMNKTIERKLIKYYRCVHPDFVNSKCFCKNVRHVITQIKSQPKLVYLKIEGLLDELKTRRNDKTIIEVDEDDEPTTVASTGDKRKDERIFKLSKALYDLKKRIAKHEAAEVDFDDEINSHYMLTERYKKRAWEIYSKICDITGESKTAERLVKKPIRFKGTSYTEFNRKLENFVNSTESFPDMYDVIRVLEHCNKNHNYRLTKEDIKSVGRFQSFDFISDNLFHCFFLFFFCFSAKCVCPSWKIVTKAPKNGSLRNGHIFYKQ